MKPSTVVSTAGDRELQEARYFAPRSSAHVRRGGPEHLRRWDSIAAEAVRDRRARLRRRRAATTRLECARVGSTRSPQAASRRRLKKGRTARQTQPLQQPAPEASTRELPRDRRPRNALALAAAASGGIRVQVYRGGSLRPAPRPTTSDESSPQGTLRPFPTAGIDLAFIDGMHLAGVRLARLHQLQEVLRSPSSVIVSTTCSPHRGRGGSRPGGAAKAVPGPATCTRPPRRCVSLPGPRRPRGGHLPRTRRRSCSCPTTRAASSTGSTTTWSPRWSPPDPQDVPSDAGADRGGCPGGPAGADIWDAMRASRALPPSAARRQLGEPPPARASRQGRSCDGRIRGCGSHQPRDASATRYCSNCSMPICSTSETPEMEACSGERRARFWRALAPAPGRRAGGVHGPGSRARSWCLASRASGLPARRRSNASTRRPVADPRHAAASPFPGGSKPSCLAAPAPRVAERSTAGAVRARLSLRGPLMRSKVGR